MKMRSGLSRLLQSNKRVMVISLLLAIAVWATVISGPSNIEERDISLTATVDLTNSYAYQSGLRIIGNAEFPVTVNVSGAWSVISRLTESDIRVRADISEVTSPGEIELPLTVSRNSLVTDYEIVSITPSSVKITCDLWESGVTFPLQTDLSALSVSDPTTMHIGDPVIDKTNFPTGELTVSGPQSTVDKIAQLVARIEQRDVLSDMALYDVPVTALDKNGNEIDMTYCTIQELETGTVHLTVPVWVQRNVQVGYTLIHAPQGLDTDSLLSVSPQNISLIGTAAELDTVSEQLQNLGAVDFERFSLISKSQIFNLDIPATVQVIDNIDKITVTLDTSGMTSRSFDISVNGTKVQAEGNLGDFSLSVPDQTLTSVVMIGPTSVIDALKQEDLIIYLDVGDTPTAGTRQFPVRIQSKTGAWMYSGGTVNGLTVYATLS